MQTTTKLISSRTSSASKSSKTKKKIGFKLCEEGKVAALIVAGGQGSRLGFSGPKGKFPVSNVKQKTLFQIFAEKTKAASELYQKDLCLAFMTSVANEKESQEYFKKNEYFGLKAEQILFFRQEQWPLLNMEGQLFLNEKSNIAYGPNGNGYALHKLFESGIWQNFWDRGIRYLNFLTIDNPLADPFDPNLFGFHHKQKADVTLKAVERIDAEEKVGVLLQKNGKAAVIEYSEIPKHEREATNSEQKMKHPLANISLFCFSMDFIQEISQEKMPLHLAKKEVKSIEGKKSAFKFETFIFDILEKSIKTRALIYPRELCFAPLKEKEGLHGLKALQKALLESDRKIYSVISGCQAPLSKNFELSQNFYYPSETLQKKWKGQALGGASYIEG